MKIKNIGLIGRIAFLVAIVEILAFSIMGYLYSDRFTYFLEKDTKDRLHQINTMIASEELPISSVTQKGFMSNMLGHEFLDGYIVGNNGFIIVASRSEFLGREFQDIPNYNEQWNIKKAGEAYFQNENILTSVSHLKNQEQEIPLYHTILSINTQKLIEAKNKIILYSIAGSLLFIILSSAAIIFFAQKFVIQRIDDSLEILHKAEQGILNTYIPITHEDELGKLQKGINSMIEQVGKLLLEYKSSVQEVKKAQQETLEEQEKLRNLNERFELTLDAVNDGIWDWEVNTDTTYFSKRWKSMLGYEDDDIENTGSAFFKLIHSDYKELVKEAIENHFKDPIKYPYSMEIKVKCKDGSYKWILARGKVFFDESGDPKRMLGYHSDITKDKENEEYLAQQNKIMEEQSKLASMGEMIGNIAHQWRQPLSTITTAATGMEFESDMDLLNNEKLHYYTESIVRNANYLSNTIDTFRDYIKEDKKPKIVTIQERIETVLQIMNASLKNHNIDIKTHMEETPLEVKIIAQELDQVIINILNNAKDALNERDIQDSWIYIDLHSQDQKIILTIEDNAGGVNETVKTHMFEPYFTTKHKSQGTGLGLHMSYKIVTESFGGNLYMQNTTNGAKFFIEIPLKCDK